MLLWLTPVGFGVTVLQEEIMGALEGVPLVFHCPAVHEVDAAECQALTVCPGAVCVCMLSYLRQLQPCACHACVAAEAVQRCRSTWLCVLSADRRHRQPA